MPGAPERLLLFWPRRPAQNTEAVSARATRKVAARVAPAVMLSRVARSEACFTDMVLFPISQAGGIAGDESSLAASLDLRASRERPLVGI